MLLAAVETVMMVLFLLCLADAFRTYDHDKKKLLLLVLSFIFVLIFENANTLLSKGHIGGHFFNQGYLLYAWHVPVFFAMGWAVLIYTAMHLSDMLELKTLTKPFMDSIIVVMLLLTLDVVATRQELWNWIGYSHTQGWFGVPADNFVAWIFAVFIFSFLFRYFERAEHDMINKATKTEYYFLLPAFAYLAMLVLFSLVNLAEQTFNLTRSEELFVLWAIVIFFAAMIRTTKHQRVPMLETDNFTLFVIIATRLVFFSYIIWSLVLDRIYQENIVLVLILLMTIFAEVLIYHSAFGHIGLKLRRSEKLESY
jgi:hypothetical protein